MRPSSSEKDQRRWTTLIFRLPQEIAIEFNKAIFVATHMGCSNGIEAIEMIAADFMATWLPAFEHQRREMTKTDMGKVRWDVLNRDSWECTRCGSVKDLHVHHIIPRSKDKSLIYDRDNCTTLCAKCHNFHHDKRTS